MLVAPHDLRPLGEQLGYNYDSELDDCDHEDPPATELAQIPPRHRRSSAPPKSAPSKKNTSRRRRERRRSTSPSKKRTSRSRSRSRSPSRSPSSPQEFEIQDLISLEHKRNSNFKKVYKPKEDAIKYIDFHEGSWRVRTNLQNGKRFSRTHQDLNKALTDLFNRISNKTVKNFKYDEEEDEEEKKL